MKKYLHFTFPTVTGVICVIDVDSKLAFDNLKKIKDEMQVWLSTSMKEPATFKGFGNRISDFMKDLDPATMVCDVKIDGKGFE